MLLESVLVKHVTAHARLICVRISVLAMRCLSEASDVQRVQRGLSGQACMTSTRQNTGKGTECPGCVCGEKCCTDTHVMSGY